MIEITFWDFARPVFLAYMLFGGIALSINGVFGICLPPSPAFIEKGHYLDYSIRLIVGLVLMTVPLVVM